MRPATRGEGRAFAGGAAVFPCSPADAAKNIIDETLRGEFHGSCDDPIRKMETPWVSMRMHENRQIMKILRTCLVDSEYDLFD